MFTGRDAEETEEWDRFWGSGKVDDYLRYISCHREAGKEKDAGFSTGDRNGDQSDSCR